MEQISTSFKNVTFANTTKKCAICRVTHDSISCPSLESMIDSKISTTPRSNNCNRFDYSPVAHSPDRHSSYDYKRYNKYDSQRRSLHGSPSSRHCFSKSPI